MVYFWIWFFEVSSSYSLMVFFLSNVTPGLLIRNKFIFEIYILNFYIHVKQICDNVHC